MPSRRPANVTDCPVCGREMGVQREFNAITRKGRDTFNGWRIARHGTPLCFGSRKPVASELVRQKVYTISV